MGALRVAGIGVYLGGLALGVSALVLVLAGSAAHGKGLSGPLVAAILYGIAGLMALTGNALYLAGLALRPFNRRFLGMITLAWGSGHLFVAFIDLPLKSPYASLIPLILAIAGLAYLGLGLVLLFGFSKRL